MLNAIQFPFYTPTYMSYVEYYLSSGSLEKSQNIGLLFFVMDRMRMDLPFWLLWSLFIVSGLFALEMESTGHYGILH